MATFKKGDYIKVAPEYHNEHLTLTNEMIVEFLEERECLHFIGKPYVEGTIPRNPIGFFPIQHFVRIFPKIR